MSASSFTSSPLQTVRPDFNEAMREKWVELWATHRVGQPRRGSTSYYKWFRNISFEYEKWRRVKIGDAVCRGEPPPPLYPVGFTEARNWAKEMKELSKSAHSQGIVNATTAQMRANLDSFMAATDDTRDAAIFNEGGIGAAVDMSTLATHVATASYGRQQFVRPTSAEVDAAFRGGRAPPKKKSSKQKRRKRQPTDPALQKRINIAAANMKRLGVSRDKKSEEKSKMYLCNVCGKYWDFKLNEVPHYQMVPGGKGSKQFRFCPLADDQTILLEYLRNKKKK